MSEDLPLGLWPVYRKDALVGYGYIDEETQECLLHETVEGGLDKLRDLSSGFKLKIEGKRMVVVEP